MIKISNNSKNLDFSPKAPKKLVENLAYREKVYNAALGDKDLQDELWLACKNDIVFFTDTFCWTYDPRPKMSKTPRTPFILWEAQEKALLTLQECINTGRDAMIIKSRDEGATWLCILSYFYQFLFLRERSFNCISRKEDLVDKTDSPDSIFWKIDYIHKNLPSFMQIGGYGKNRMNMHVKNNETDSVINGEATSGDAGVGGRTTSMFLDELGLNEHGTQVWNVTADVTDCRIANSTPRGVHNQFGRLRLTNIIKIYLLWYTDPRKNKGLYKAVNGRLVKLDEDYKYPEDYKFILDTDEKLRSPWYDYEEERRQNARYMAQEIDANFIGAGSLFFDLDVIDALTSGVPDRKRPHLKSTVCDPVIVSELEYSCREAEPIGVDENAGRGRLRLWVNLVRGKPPQNANYVCGVDISAGTGASNSCITVYNSSTNELAAEFACPNTRPEELAEYAVALCRWFGGKTGNPLLIWEFNGPGRNFGSHVVDLGYDHIYMRSQETNLSKKASKIPGWFSSPENKRSLLGVYARLLRTGEITNKSEESLRECLMYEYVGNSVEIPNVNKMDDPSGARDNHGDRVIATALCCLAMTYQDKVTDEKREVPFGSVAWRMRKLQGENRENEGSALW